MSTPEVAAVPEESFEAFFATENAAERGDQKVEEKPAETPKPNDEPAPEPVAAKSDDKQKTKAEEAKKPRENPQARIDQAIARQREAERRAEAAERRNQELEAAQRPQPRVEPPAETPQSAYKRYMALPEAPKRTEFEDPAEWSVATSAFVGEKRFEEQQRREQFALNQQIDAQRGQQFHDRAIAKDPKFFETLQARIAAEGDPPVNRPVQDYIKTSPLGPDLLVYLLDHTDDAQRISALPPLESREAIAEIAGSLKARQTAASQAPRPTPVLSRAPAPIPPAGGSLTPADVSDDDASFEEFYRRENAKARR